MKMTDILERVLCPLGLHWWTAWNDYGYRYCSNCEVKQRRL